MTALSQPHVLFFPRAPVNSVNVLEPARMEVRAACRNQSAPIAASVAEFVRITGEARGSVRMERHARRQSVSVGGVRSEDCVGGSVGVR